MPFAMAAADWRTSEIFPGMFLFQINPAEALDSTGLGTPHGRSVFRASTGLELRDILSGPERLNSGQTPHRLQLALREPRPRQRDLSSRLHQEERWNAHDPESIARRITLPRLIKQRSERYAELVPELPGGFQVILRNGDHLNVVALRKAFEKRKRSLSYRATDFEQREQRRFRGDEVSKRLLTAIHVFEMKIRSGIADAEHSSMLKD